MPKIKNVFVYKPEQLPDDYSAVRGPCPEGYHLPAKSDFDRIISMMSSRGINTYTEYEGLLKMPLMGRRYGASDVAYAGDHTHYLACTATTAVGPSETVVTCDAIGISTTYISTATGNNTSKYGYPIRPFKDIPIKPEPSETGRTGLYITGSNRESGIAENTALGIISIRDNNGKCLTIANKNLGATEAYVAGGGYTAARCGYFYQRGNNYGFAFSGTVSTTSAQSDTSNYGPSTYSKSSFYDGSSSNRMNPINLNLRGGVTGVVPGGTVLVEKEVYPGFSGVYQEVEYIESSGTQYIDTGISANQYLSFESELAALGTTNDSPLFGARTGATNGRFGLIVYGGNFHMMIGDTSASSFNNTPVDTNKHICSVFVDNGSYTATIDGNTSAGSASTTAYVNQNFWLFKYNYGSVSPCPMKLYYFKLYTGTSTLVRDFIPCYRKSDGVIGLYDKVGKQFYTNQGSGTFTKGPNI